MVAWEEVDVGSVPKGFEKEIPIFEVIKSYILKNDIESLEVKRAFSVSSGESTRIKYCGAQYIEDVIISDAKIIRVDTLLVEKMHKFPDPSLPEEEMMEQLQKYFNQAEAKPKIKTYHNIKRFEDRLRELPWQHDLFAVYNGSGYFTDNSG